MNDENYWLIPDSRNKNISIDMAIKCHKLDLKLVRILLNRKSIRLLSYVDAEVYGERRKFAKYIVEKPFTPSRIGSVFGNVGNKVKAGKYIYVPAYNYSKEEIETMRGKI